MTLGEKLLFLVQAFEKDPDVFNDYYKGTKLIGTNYVCSSTPSSNIYISVGEFENGSGNRRYINNINDTISYSPVPDINGFGLMNPISVDMHDLVIYDSRKNNNHVYQLHDLSVYCESYMFQLGLVLGHIEYETLEAFIFLKNNCSTAFRIAIDKINLDEINKIYAERNQNI